MTSTVALAVTLAGVILGPLVTYIVAARKLSGKVATSDAASLWEESASIRADYRERLAACNERIRLLEDRVNQLAEANALLITERAKIEASARALEQEVAKLHTVNEHLGGRVLELTDEVGRLQETIGRA